MGQTFGSTHMSNRHLWTRKDYGKRHILLQSVLYAATVAVMVSQSIHTHNIYFNVYPSSHIRIRFYLSNKINTQKM